MRARKRRDRHEREASESACICCLEDAGKREAQLAASRLALKRAHRVAVLDLPTKYTLRDRKVEIETKEDRESVRVSK